MKTRVNAWRMTSDASMTLPLCLALLTLVLWIDRETLPDLVLRLFPSVVPHPAGPCTGAPIPC
ncbi:MAG: hypothetical protein ACHQ4H_18515 [Ktedonobacterales bacterium]